MDNKTLYAVRNHSGNIAFFLDREEANEKTTPSDSLYEVPLGQFCQIDSGKTPVGWTLISGTSEKSRAAGSNR